MFKILLIAFIIWFIVFKLQEQKQSDANRNKNDSDGPKRPSEPSTQAGKTIKHTAPRAKISAHADNQPEIRVTQIKKPSEKRLPKVHVTVEHKKSRTGNADFQDPFKIARPERTSHSIISTAPIQPKKVQTRPPVEKTSPKSSVNAIPTRKKREESDGKQHVSPPPAPVKKKKKKQARATGKKASPVISLDSETREKIREKRDEKEHKLEKTVSAEPDKKEPTGETPAKEKKQTEAIDDGDNLYEEMFPFENDNEKDWDPIFSEENKLLEILPDLNDLKKVFSEVLVSETCWKKVNREPAYRNKFEHIIRRIMKFVKDDFQLKSNRLRRLANENTFKIRITHGDRLIFSLEHSEKEQDDSNVRYKLTMWDILKHREAEKLHREKGAFSEKMFNIIPAEQDEIPGNPPLIFRVWRQIDASRLEDLSNSLQWKLHDKQKLIVSSPGPVLCSGGAGSGKTTIAIFRLLKLENDEVPQLALFVTYTKSLLKFAEETYLSFKDTNRMEHLDFYTVDDLCRRIVKAPERFPDDKKMTFEKFKRIPYFGQTRLPVSLEMLWEEIRGVLKGFDVTPISLEEYFEKPKKFCLVDNTDKKAVYKAFEVYQNYLKKKELWDEMDLAAAAYVEMEEQHSDRSFQNRYNHVVVDEVQDLTMLQIRLILKMSQRIEGLFFTGDVQQILHPSRFQWSRLKDVLHETAESRWNLKRNRSFLDKLRVQWISENYRSVKDIVELGNNLQAWKRSVLGAEGDDWIALHPLRTGRGLIRVEPFEPSYWTNNKQFSHRLMVIVPLDEDIREEACSLFGKARVFNVIEAKGLESDFVILWKLFETPFWKNWRKDMAIPDSVTKAVTLRLMLNQLTVAFGRARERLVFCDSNLPEEWKVFENIPMFEGNSADKFVREILSEKSSSLDYEELAELLEKRGNLEQAGHNYILAGNMRKANACFARHFERMEMFEDAAQCYKNAENYTKAVECFEEVKEFSKAFEIIVHHDSQKIKEYLNDKRKLARLVGVEMEIVKALEEGRAGISEITLLEYGLNRSRHSREYIKRIIRDDFVKQRVRDARRVGDEIIQLCKNLTR